MGKFCQFLTELSVRSKSRFSLPDDNLSKNQSVFTKLGICIDIMEIWLGLSNGQISPVFYRVVCPPCNSGGVLLFHVYIFFPENKI